jgi:hypothetical protein
MHESAKKCVTPVNMAWLPEGFGKARLDAGGVELIQVCGRPEPT